MDGVDNDDRQGKQKKGRQLQLPKAQDDGAVEQVGGKGISPCSGKEKTTGRRKGQEKDTQAKA